MGFRRWVWALGFGGAGCTFAATGGDGGDGGAEGSAGDTGAASTAGDAAEIGDDGSGSASAGDDTTTGVEPDGTGDDAGTDDGPTTDDAGDTTSGDTTGSPGTKGCEDQDGDGYGNPEMCSTDPPADWVDNSWDCDDDDPYLGPCPASCPAMSSELSCSTDLESIGTGSAPGCPASDLTWDATPGPGDYAVITAADLNANWYGHDITDHTSGGTSGKVFYGDLGSSPPVGSAYWREVVDVETDTTYMVHLWIKNTATNEASSTDPTVGIRVNGDDLFDDFTVPNYVGDPATWDPISVIFESGSATELTVEVVNWADTNGGLPGLDIAIDDVTIVACD